MKKFAAFLLTFLMTVSTDSCHSRQEAKMIRIGQMV